MIRGPTRRVVLAVAIVAFMLIAGIGSGHTLAAQADTCVTTQVDQAAVPSTEVVVGFGMLETIASSDVLNVNPPSATSSMSAEVNAISAHLVSGVGNSMTIATDGYVDMLNSSLGVSSATTNNSVTTLDANRGTINAREIDQSSSSFGALAAQLQLLSSTVAAFWHVATGSMSLILVGAFALAGFAGRELVTIRAVSAVAGFFGSALHTARSTNAVT